MFTTGVKDENKVASYVKTRDLLDEALYDGIGGGSRKEAKPYTIPSAVCISAEVFRDVKALLENSFECGVFSVGRCVVISTEANSASKCFLMFTNTVGQVSIVNGDGKDVPYVCAFIVGSPKEAERVPISFLAGPNMRARELMFDVGNEVELEVF